MIVKKLDVKWINDVLMGVSSTAIDLCNQEIAMAEEMQINYTYTELGKQMMILDIGAPVSLAGISRMTQYLQEFGLTI